MKKYWIAAALIVELLPAAAQAALPEWMAGTWCTEGPKTDRTCEYWTPVDGGIMLGASIDVKGGKAVEWEQLRILVVDGVPVYLASPGGASPVPFRSTASDARSITFANPSHDYPQRIRYWRENKTLIAEISLADGGKAKRWEYRPGK